MTARRRRIATLALRAGVSIAILSYLFYHVPVREALAAVAGADRSLVLLALALIPPMAYVAAAQQNVLTRHQGMPLSILHLIEVNLATQFYGLFLPGYLAGGVFRWHRMAQLSKQRAESAAAIAFNRWLETLVVLSLGVAFWLTGRPPGVRLTVVPVLMLGLLALAVSYLVLFDRRWLDRVEILPRLASGGRVRRMIGRLLETTGRFGTLPLRHGAAAAGLCLLRQQLAIVSLLAFAAALEIRLGYASAGWIHCALSVALMLPIAYAGLGVREASLVALLALLGVPAQDALALSFLLLLRTLLPAAAGGVLEAARAFTGRTGLSDRPT